jgi:hypothetical protein
VRSPHPGNPGCVEDAGALLPSHTIFHATRFRAIWADLLKQFLRNGLQLHVAGSLVDRANLSVLAALAKFILLVSPATE